MQQVVNLLGDEDTAANYLSRCIFSIGLGSNDYLNNYFQPLYYSTAQQFSPEQYADVLIQQYTEQLNVSSIYILLSCVLTYLTWRFLNVADLIRLWG